MRAARMSSAWNWPQRTAEAACRKAPDKADKPEQASRPLPHRVLSPAFVFAFLFLAGYMAGIVLCRTGIPDFGAMMAEYYMDKQNFSSFLPVYCAQVSALFLQIVLLLLCGGNVVGFALTPAFFAGKGALLGICAASVLAQSGARGLVVYWLLTGVQDAAVLILLIWVAQAGHHLSTALLKNLMTGAAVRGAMKVKAKILGMRGLFGILVGAGISALGTGAAVLFASVLL